MRQGTNKQSLNLLILTSKPRQVILKQTSWLKISCADFIVSECEEEKILQFNPKPRDGKGSRMSERVFLLDVKCPQRYVDKIP